MLVIVRGNRSPIFGRNWLREIKINWSEIIKSEKQVSAVVAYTTFVEIYVKSTKIYLKVNVAVKPNALPEYKKAKPVLWPGYSPILILKITYLNFAVAGIILLIILRSIKPFSFSSS